VSDNSTLKFISVVLGVLMAGLRLVVPSLRVLKRLDGIECRLDSIEKRLTGLEAD